MTDSLDTAPVTRRAQRELERAAERAAARAKYEAGRAVSTAVQDAVAQDAVPASPARLASVVELSAAVEAPEAEVEAPEVDAAEVKAEVHAAPMAEAVAPVAPAAPVELATRRAQREAERAAARAERAAARATEASILSTTSERVETLNVDAEPVVLAPVVSLEQARENRGSEDAAMPTAPANEPEIPAAFLRDQGAAAVLPYRATHRSTRFGGLVAASLVAGSVLLLGAGSAMAITMFSSQGSSGNAEHPVSEPQQPTPQSYAVAGSVKDADTLRKGDVTAVTSIGSAAAANLAKGVLNPNPNSYTNDITANVQWPFPMGVKLTDGYGPRNGPAGTSPFHGGVDFVPGEGTPIGSIADGVVKRVVNAGVSTLGAFVEVEHVINGQHVTSLYAHLNPASVVVRKGDRVQVGDEIARVGNTGLSTGPHLHLEIHVNGYYVNPLTFLKKMNVPGVPTEFPTELTHNVGDGQDEKLPDPDSDALILELFGK